MSGSWMRGAALVAVAAICAGFGIADAQSATSTASAACPQLTATLARGAADASAHGPVRELQAFLSTALASSSPFTPTGFFGPLTQARVIAFQQQFGIATSGIVDAATRAAIAAFCTGTAGSTGSASTSIAVPPPPPVALFDQGSSFTSLDADPTITGTVSVAAPQTLRMVIQPIVAGVDEAALYENDAVPVRDGAWSAHVLPSLPDGSYAVSIYGDSVLLGAASMQVGLVSFPTIVQDFSLPAYDVADGRLMRFGIHAQPSGPVSIEQLSFAVATSSADVSAASLYAYTDPAYSQPLSSSTAGLLNANPADPSSGDFTIAPDDIFVIPAGETYYFELDATVAPSDTSYWVATTLLGDAPTEAGTLQALPQLATSTNFVWSPDTFDTSSTTVPDWATGALVYGLSSGGMQETRYNTPAQLPPTCIVTASPASITPPQSVAVSWTTTDAQYVAWNGGARYPPEGSATVLVASAPYDFSLTATGKYGVGGCSVIVSANSASSNAGSASATVPGSASVATTSAATSTPDGFSASPASGIAPLTVSFIGTVNNADSCAASTYTFAYGDNSTTTISVAAKACKPQSFTLSHTYQKSAVYSAKLYRGAFPYAAGMAPQLVQTQTVAATGTVKKVSDAAPSPFGNVAAVAEAARGSLQAIEAFIQSFFSLFAR